MTFSINIYLKDYQIHNSCFSFILTIDFDITVDPLHFSYVFSRLSTDHENTSVPFTRIAAALRAAKSVSGILNLHTRQDIPEARTI